MYKFTVLSRDLNPEPASLKSTRMSKTQSLIEQFYQEEQQRLADEAAFTPLDMTIGAADMAMLSTIAKRFAKDKSLFAREALAQALVDMFSALEPAERKMLAKEADELANSISAEIAEEQGLSSFTVNGTNWVSQDKACTREEKKAEKERLLQAQKEQQAQQTVAAETTMSEAAEITQSTSEETIEMAEENSQEVESATIEETTEQENSAVEAPSSIFGTM